MIYIFQGGAGLQPCTERLSRTAASAAGVHVVLQGELHQELKPAFILLFHAGLKACSTQFTNNAALDKRATV
jgi:hypothetical protein